MGIVVQGDTGIGKSRLIAEFVARLDNSDANAQLIAVAATSQTTAAPLSMVVEYMQAALNLLPGRGENARAQLAQALASRLRHHVGADEVIEACQSFELAMELRDGALGINEDAEGALRERCADTIAMMLRCQTQDRPSLVVLENFHLADSASAGVVRHLLSQGHSDMPCLFVLSAIHELADEHRIPEASTIRLEELLDEDRAELIHDRLAEADEADGAIEVARRAGGNPLYIEELCHAIREVGWDATPATVRDSVVARIDRLSKRSRAVLQRAAVIGESFRSSILEELIGVAAGPHLQELVEEGLLVQDNRLDVQSHGGVFSFRHGLIQEVVYSSLSASPRRSAHANLGKLLASRADAGYDEPPALVARHLKKGGELAASAAQWVRAGRVALAGFEVASASEAFTTAIQLIHQLSPDERTEQQGLLRDALFGRSRVYRDIGDHESQGADLATLAALCENDSAEHAELLVCVAEKLLRQGAFDEALAEARRACDVAKKANAPIMHGEALRIVGEGLERTGHCEEGQESTEEALDIFESLGARGYATRARISLARNFLMRARYADAKAIYDPIIAEVQRNRNPGIERIASNHLAVIHMCIGEFEDAMKCAQRSVSLCEADGDLARAGDNLSVCGIILNEVGQFPLASTYFERALSLERETNSRWSEADCLIYAGTNAVMLGDVATGVERLELAHQYANEINSPYVRINACIGLAEALLIRDNAGDVERAFEFAQKASAQASEAGLAGAEAMALTRQAQALHQLGDSGGALELSRAAVAILDKQVYVEGSEEEILHTHYVLLEATASVGTAKFLQRAIAGMERKLAVLKDPAWRDTFCNAVRVNVALRDLVEETTK